MKWIRLAVLCAIAMFAVTSAEAQHGGIAVSVLDPDGEPLPGATVTISHATSSVKTTAELTDKGGGVEFPVLRPGDGYKIQVSFPGYSPFEQDGLRVTIGRVLRLPVQLLKTLQEQVKVTAQRDVIDLDQTEQSTKFTDDFVQDLPVPGRFYQNVLTMAPGVQDADGDGNPNVHGSRSRDFKAVVSGISNVDPLTGQQMSEVNPNSIEEMQIITAGAGVEFGRAQGGFARIIQKQGSNEHEGVFEFYWRTSDLDGGGANDTSNIGRQEFEWIQPSFQLSGPLVKDKLWYRFSHSYSDVEQPLVGAENLEVSQQTRSYNADQVTWQVSPRNKLAFQYQTSPLDWKNFGISTFVSPESSSRLEFDDDTFTLAWTAPYSPRLLVESNFGWQEFTIKQSPTISGAQNDCVASGADFLTTSQCDNLDLGQRSGSYFANFKDFRQRLTTSTKATMFGPKFFGVSHQFKFGLSVENERYFRDLTIRPQIRYQILREQPEEGGAIEANSVGIALANIAIPQSDLIRATSTNWGAYVEDQFRPRPNMTVTLGARVDRTELNSEGSGQFNPATEFQQYLVNKETLPDNADRYNSAFTGYENLAAFASEIQGILCAGDPDLSCPEEVGRRIQKSQAELLFRIRRDDDIVIANTNFSPFVAFSWSPWSNGKTAFKATAGRHYNNVPLIPLLQELEPENAQIVYRVDPVTLEAAPDSSVGTAVAASVVDRNFKTPYQDEVTFSIERELWAETSVTFTYINRQYRDQIQDENVNLEVGDFGICSPNTPSSPPIVTSPGTGLVEDAFTGVQYMDTDPGDGDGVLDDCIGDLFVIDTSGTDTPNPIRTSDNFLAARPDGIVDLYTQNPFWGDIFQIGNVNSADYEAFVLELVRRQYRSWEFNASYTWSEAIGDGEDFFQALGDDPSLRDNVRGYQSYDQRHVVKFNATTITPWGIRIGTAATWQSGLPFSIVNEQPSYDALPLPLPDFLTTASRFNPRQRYQDLDGNPLARNSARNPSYWNFDVKATKEMNLGRGLNLQMSAEVYNLLNDGTYRIYNRFQERGQQTNGNNEADPRFGRRWQLSVKLAF